MSDASRLRIESVPVFIFKHQGRVGGNVLPFLEKLKRIS